MPKILLRDSSQNTMSHLWRNRHRLSPLGAVLLRNIERSLELQSRLSDLRLHVSATTMVVCDWLHARSKLIVVLLVTIFVFTSPLLLADCPDTIEA